MTSQTPFGLVIADDHELLAATLSMALRLSGLMRWRFAGRQQKP